MNILFRTSILYIVQKFMGFPGVILWLKFFGVVFFVVVVLLFICLFVVFWLGFFFFIFNSHYNIVLDL